MKKIWFLALLVIITLTSYKYIQHTQSAAATLITKTYKHPFSNPNKPDVFILSLTGRSILTGTVTFQIIDFNGKQLFKEKYPAKDFLVGETDIFSPKQLAGRIKDQISHFFDATNYATPAISSKDKYDADYSDKKVWNNIKADRSAVGFTYAHGYEGTYRIAWSKKWGKVVVYLSMD